MSYKRWKNNVLAKPGAEERVATIRAELLRAAGLTEVEVRSIAPDGAVDEPS